MTTMRTQLNFEMSQRPAQGLLPGENLTAQDFTSSGRHTSNYSSGPLAKAPRVARGFSPTQLRTRSSAVASTSHRSPSPALGATQFETLQSYRRSLTGLVGAAGFLVSSTALAADPQIPVYDPSDTVVCLANPCPIDEARVEKAIAESDYPFYVVVFGSVGGQVGNSTQTNRVGKELNQTWRDTPAYDDAFSTLIVMSEKERGVSTHSGVYWNETHGFTGSKLKSYETNQFIPNAKQGDLTQAFIAEIDALDRDYVSASGLDTLRSDIRTLLSDAKSFEANSALTPQDDVSELHVAVRKAKDALESKYNGHKEYRHGILKSARDDLRKEVTTIRQLIEERVSTAALLDDLIVATKKSLASPEIIAGENWSTVKRELAEAKVAQRSGNHADIKKAESELRTAAQDLSTKIEERQILRGNVTAATGIAEKLLQDSEILPTDNLSPLKLALAAAQSSLEQQDYKAMAANLVPLKTENDAWSAEFSTRAETRRALKEVHSDISELQRAMETSLKESKDLLAEDDLTGYHRAIEQAKEAYDSNDLIYLKEIKESLKSNRAELDQLIETRYIEAVSTAALIALGLGVVGIAFIGGVVLFVRRLLSYLEKRGNFTSAATVWKTKLQNAKVSHMEFTNERDLLKSLKSKTGDTKAKYDEISQILDEITVRIAGLEKHIASQEIKLTQTGFFKSGFGPLEQALSGLNDQFEFDTGKVDRTQLFEEAREIKDVMSPSEFENSMKAKFLRVHKLWEKILNARDKSQIPARQAFPVEGYTEIRTQLAAVGVPLEWLETHALHKDSEAYWAEMDELRATDFVKYVTNIDKDKKHEEELFETLKSLILQLSRIQTVKEQAQSINVNYHETVIDDPALDPRSAEDTALQAVASLQARLVTSRNPEKITAEIDAVVKSYETVIQRKVFVVNTMKEIESKLSMFEREMTAQDVALSSAEQTLIQLAKHHVDSSLVLARAERAEASIYRDRAQTSFSEAKALLADRRHLESRKKLEEAIGFMTAANTDLNDFKTEIARLNKVRENYAQLHREMPNLLQQKHTKMNEYGEYANPSLFETGNAMLDQLPRDIETFGRQDWERVSGELRKVIAAWDRALEIVDNHKDVGDAEGSVAALVKPLEKLLEQSKVVPQKHSRQHQSTLDQKIGVINLQIRQARSALAEAQTLLASGKDKEAEKKAFAARDFAEAASSLMREATKSIAELERVREEYETAYRKLNDAREKYKSRLKRSGSFGRKASLERGDSIYRNLPEPGASGEDWAQRLAEQALIITAWKEVTEKAERSHQRQLAEAAAAAAAEAQRQQEAAAATYSAPSPSYDYGSSGGSTFGSGSSGDSGGSTW